MLDIDGVTMRFGALVVTDNVSLRLRDGMIAALIGPNGAGKTSLFNQISGFLRPASGDIRLRGNRVVGQPPEAICLAGVGRTFQIAQPFPGLTVEENIAVGAHLRRRRRADALAHARAIGGQVGLGGQLQKRASALTVAGRKRLELAKALATDPVLLLLDEVMAGLTPAEIDEILPVIRTIRDRGVTILLIEHVMRAVMNLCDHAWVLAAGALIAEGTPRQIATDPTVVEAYLGRGAAQRMLATAGRGDHA